jgi:helix-turn-helix protein
MGRPDRPLDPDAGPLAAFAAGLRELRSQAGNPTYRSLAEQTHYSPTTLSDAAGGRKLPTLPVTLAYARVCGGDESVWRERWEQVSRELRAAESSRPAGASLDSEPRPRVPRIEAGPESESEPEPGPEPDIDPGEAAPRRRDRFRQRPRLAIALSLCVVAGSAVAAVDIPPRQPDRTKSLAAAKPSRPTTSATPVASASTTPALASAPPTVSQSTSGSPPAQSPSAAPAVVVVATSPHAPATSSGAARNPVIFTALTGEDCPQNASMGVVVSGGNSAWQKQSGSWTGDGCTGYYAETQVDGSNSPGRYSYTWNFTTTSAPDNPCDVQVYVPTPTGDSSLVGGDPAYYQVLNGPSDTYYASFTVDQLDNHGTWMDAGTYPSSQGHIAVRLTNQGKGSADVAAAALRISCTAG